MCPNCIIAMLLGMFVCWRMIEEDKSQSFEDMQDEMIKKEIKKREQL